MNLDAFQIFSEGNQWSAIMPEMFLAGLALVLLGLETVFGGRDRQLVLRVSIWGQVLLLGLLVIGYLDGFPLGRESVFSGLLVQGPATEIMRLFFLAGSILVCFFASHFLDRQALPRTEYHAIALIITASLMLLVQSRQFVMLFVALETVTVGFYILVGYNRRSTPSLEAGLKYLVLGALSSAILLFGIVLLYGVAGNPDLPGRTTDGLDFTALAGFIAANPDNPLVLAGAGLVLAGLAFKIGAVPFQIWIPDVYHGAPTPTTAFLAVSSKAAGLLVLLALVDGPFAALESVLVPLLSAVAVLTILFGNLAALPQRNVKRLMGLSGIAHAGYLLVGVIASFQVDWAIYAVLFYLITYFLASFGVFGVMTVLSGDDDADQELDHYVNLARRQPFLAGVLTIGLGSLAGIPPLAGFIGKLLIFIAAWQAGLYALLGVSVVGVVLSIYYYFGWIREAVFRVWRPVPEPGEPSAAPGPVDVRSTMLVTLGGLSALSLVIGLSPQLVEILRNLP